MCLLPAKKFRLRRDYFGLASIMLGLKPQKLPFEHSPFWSNRIIGIAIFVISCQVAIGITSNIEPPLLLPPWLDDVQEHIAQSDAPHTNVNIQAILPLLIVKSKNGDAWAEGFLGSLMMEGQEIPLNYREGARLLRDSAGQGCVNAMIEPSSLKQKLVIIIPRGLGWQQTIWRR